MFRNCCTDKSGVGICVCACLHESGEGGVVVVRRKNLNNNDLRKQRLERNMPLKQCTQLYLPSHNLDKTKLKVCGKLSMVYQYLCCLEFTNQQAPMQMFMLHKGNIVFGTSCFKSYALK